MTSQIITFSFINPENEVRVQLFGIIWAWTGGRMSADSFLIDFDTSWPIRAALSLDLNHEKKKKQLQPLWVTKNANKIQKFRDLVPSTPIDVYSTPNAKNTRRNHENRSQKPWKQWKKRKMMTSPTCDVIEIFTFLKRDEELPGVFWWNLEGMFYVSRRFIIPEELLVALIGTSQTQKESFGRHFGSERVKI